MTLSPFWRQVAVWVAAGALGALAVQPYVLELQGEALDPAREALGGTGPLVVALALQATVQVAIATVIGLAATRPIGLAAPVSAAFAARAPWRALAAEQARAGALPGVVGGLAVTGLGVALADVVPPELGAVGAATHTGAADAVRGLLASLYGGVAEELLMRLFAMGGLAWMMCRVTGQATVTAPIAWAANLTAATLFGLGHLPGVVGLVPITPGLLAWVLLGNGVIGVLCGWLFWRRGLEAAMVAHFTADLVLHVAVPLARGLFAAPSP